MTKWIKKAAKFDDTEIEECKFHQQKDPFSINNKDIDKIVVTNKVPFGKKKILNIYWL